LKKFIRQGTEMKESPICWSIFEQGGEQFQTTKRQVKASAMIWPNLTTTDHPKAWLSWDIKDPNSGTSVQLRIWTPFVQNPPFVVSNPTLQNPAYTWP
jgi:hypothetical protein